MNHHYKPQRIGINPEWVILYVLKPLSIIIVCIVIGLFITSRLHNYDKVRKEKLAYELQISESINQEKTKELAIRKEQEEKERIRQSIEAQESEVAIHRQKVNAEYESTISSKAYKLKRYVRNDKTKEYGRICAYNGLTVLTYEGWTFDIDPNLAYNPDVVEVSYYEWYKDHKEKLQKEKMDNIDKRSNDAFLEEQRKLSKETEKKFPLRYSYIRTKDGIYDQVKGYDGLILITKGKRRVLSTECERVSPKEYFDSKVGGNR